MGEEKEILLRGNICAYLTGRLMGDPEFSFAAQPQLLAPLLQVIHRVIAGFLVNGGL